MHVLTTRLSSLGMIASLVVLIMAFGAFRAESAPITGARVFVQQDGPIVARFIGHSAAFSNDLFLDSPTNSLGIIINNQTTPVGTTVNLGSFLAGTELIFRIRVNNTGNDFFTGPAERNPDARAHAQVDFDFSPTEARIDFEDLFNGPFNFNDLSFGFTNISSVPEPGTALLVGMGLLGLGARPRAFKRPVRHVG